MEIMKATKMGTLATALAVIGRESADLESKADTVLRIVRAEKIKEGKQFNKAVRAAYKANGWNVHAGKPKAGAEKLTPVPATVKQYVSAIRAAFRFKLHVASYSSFYALRQDLAKERAKRKPKNGRTRPEMAGLTVSRPDIMTGSPFHDLVVLYNALDRARRPRMLSALDRVKRDFANAAPQLVMASLPEMRMAA
jgi:hypothetical protein